jgi:hypothetical protein
MEITKTDKQLLIKFIPYMIVPMLIQLWIGELLNLLTLVSLYLGWKYAPRIIWQSWLTSVVLLWAVMGSATLLGIVPFEEGGETWWSFALEAFIFMAMLVAIPMWIGRWIKRRRTS